MDFKDFDPYGRSQLEDELRRNQEAGIAPQESQPGYVDDLAQEASGNMGLDTSETKVWVPLHETLASTAKLFDRIRLTVPGEQDLRDAGFDLEQLKAAYSEMETNYLEPMLVLSPILALDGSQGWKDLFEKLAQDDTISDNPLEFQNDGGLFVNEDVRANWNKINHYAIGNQDGTNAHVVQAYNPNSRFTAWQLAVVPTTNRPPEVNVSHDINNKNHPTVGAYLTMQAIRIQDGDEPTDAGYYTWLAGFYLGDRDILRGPCVGWLAALGQISLARHGVSERLNYLGARQPMWA